MKVSLDHMHRIAADLSDLLKERLEQLGKELSQEDEDQAYEMILDMLEKYTDISYPDSQY